MHLLGEQDEEEVAEGVAAPEHGRDVAGIRPTMALLDDERDDPAGECHLKTGGDELEQGHSVNRRQAQNLLVLLDALRGMLRLAQRLADRLQTVYTIKGDRADIYVSF